MSERERASPTAVSTDFLTTSVLTTATEIIITVLQAFFSRRNTVSLLRNVRIPPTAADPIAATWTLLRCSLPGQAALFPIGFAGQGMLHHQYEKNSKTEVGNDNILRAFCPCSVIKREGSRGLLCMQTPQAI